MLEELGRAPWEDDSIGSYRLRGRRQHLAGHQAEDRHTFSCRLGGRGRG
jgi:hypothetical protein